MAKLRNYVTGGSARITGASVAGNILLAVDWNYGNVYVYDVSQADDPIFKGVFFALYTLRVEADPANDVAYVLSAYGRFSGIYSFTLSTLDPFHRVKYTSCERCDYFPSPATDYGGLAVSLNGKYVVYIAGKQGEVRVLNVSDPANIQSVGSWPLGSFGGKTAESLGVALKDQYIFTAAGRLGLQVFSFHGLSH